eukprot:GILI01000768.1.p1 GENE.GILI01000768.1~~GILI01000768.1.p1  ORF type:complete len:202 (+),score=37.38 GILI01000768.1:591-1196(+)
MYCSCSSSTTSREDPPAYALLTAARTKDLNTVRRLLDSSSETSATDLLAHTDEEGQTALHLACGVEGNIRVVKVLLDAGALLTVASTLHGTPLNVAVQLGDTEIEAVVLNAVVQTGSAGICFAAKDGIYHENPLHTAIRRCDVGMALALLASGADINAAAGDSKGDSQEAIAVCCTPLQLASVDTRNAPVVELLTTLGAAV